MADEHISESVELSRIFLDLKNPRHEPYETQAQVIGYLCQNEETYALARDIVENGTNPLEQCALVPDDPNDKDGSTYFVAEGNRRVCAIKLLNDPALAPAYLRSKFEKLADSWRGMQHLRCIIFSDRKAASIWLERTHSGFQDGIGRKQWNAEQKTRHTSNNKNKLAQTILDYAVAKKLLDTKDRKGKITTVQRYLSNRLVRGAMGIDKSNLDDIRRDRPRKDFDRLVRKFVEDLVEGKVHSRSNQPQIDNYAKELLMLEGLTVQRLGIAESISNKEEKEEEEERKEEKPKPPKVPEKKKCVTYEREIEEALKELKATKLQRLYYSIHTVSVKDHAQLIAVGIWSLLESLTAIAGRKQGASFFALAGRKQGASFFAFFSKEKLEQWGLGKGNETKALREAIERLANAGNATKHDGISAAFDSEQIVNDMDKLKELIIICAEKALDNDQSEG